MNARTQEHNRRIRRARNTFLMLVSLYVAYELWYTGIIEVWVSTTSLPIIPTSFIAGIFFTSLFTIAPASVVLAEMIQVSSPWLISGVGALGAVLGDIFLLMVVRTSISAGGGAFLNGSERRHLKALMRHPLLHWLLPAVGALIIASPLPDELGLALLGFSRLNLPTLIAISYAMNFLGIFTIAQAVGHLL